MDQALVVVTQVGILVFVVASMAALGLKLTPTQILTPLRDVRMIAGVLAANFVVVPAIAITVARTFPIDDITSSVIILLGCCAGAPFLPTLAKLAHADEALAVGVMVLQMVVTVAFAPLVVPLAIRGADVSAWSVAQSLLLFMLLPLALGLVVRSRLPQGAETASGYVARASSVGLVVGIVAALMVTWEQVLESIGSFVFIGTAIIIIVGLAAGWIGGVGRSTGDRLLLGLGGAQRNISAALVIAASLTEQEMVRTLVAALFLPIALIVLAGQIGKRRALASSGTVREV